VVIDAIRCCKLALDRGLKGALVGPSAYFMKSPPIQYTDDEAHRMLEEFIITNQSKEIRPTPEKKQKK
jgi:myo-inositol-1-phosphate synthase